MFKYAYRVEQGMYDSTTVGVWGKFKKALQAAQNTNEIYGPVYIARHDLTTGKSRIVWQDGAFVKQIGSGADMEWKTVAHSW